MRHNQESLIAKKLLQIDLRDAGLEKDGKNYSLCDLNYKFILGCHSTVKVNKN